MSVNAILAPLLSFALVLLKSLLMLKECIQVINARQNNLKGISLQIPLNRLTVVTGLSGAGKSSLVHDVLYAEGQRRYVETFSPYARQFIERLDRPQVDRIEGILPAIAIEQNQSIRTSRSTVGTMTELTDHLKLLFTHLATFYCPDCGRPIRAYDVEEILKELLTNYPSQKAIVCFPLEIKQPEADRAWLLQMGFERLLIDGNVTNVDEIKLKPHLKLFVLIDRLIIKPEIKGRLFDALQMAYQFGKGELGIWLPSTSEMLLFSQEFKCPYCQKSYRRPQPNLFSFNSPLGACPTCRGFGRIIDYDLDLIIPDPNKSLEEGAIKVWKRNSREFQDLMSFCQSQGIPTDIAFKALKPEQKRLIVEGSKGFYGIKGFFKWLETKSYKMHVRVFLSRYRGYFTCPDCQGTRFKKEVLCYRIYGKNIAEILAMSIDEAYEFFKQNLADFKRHPAVGIVISEIISRLSYLKKAGVGYLTLDRQSRTLSGGEVARVNLTKALGTSLVNVLFVLDEPTVGLHPKDNQKMIGIFKELAQENTVVVVEHEKDIIEAADYIIELGPGAGEKGGQLVFAGSLSQFKQADTLTARYLRENPIKVPVKRRLPQGWLIIEGAKEHNLKNITVSFPLRVMCCLTGVSGSGKSTLAIEVLYKGIKRLKGQSSEKPGRFDNIKGLNQIQDVVLVDQRPIAQTPRANPATYLGVFSLIRNFFASLPEAKAKNLTPKAFSFNTPGGRCPACQGAGYEKVEMQFLSDIYLKCPVCQGKRYRPEILEIKFRGKSIADVLDLTFNEAYEFFKNQPQIRRLLKPAIEVGLGYLRLGQPLNTLSGGEASRLKLAKFIKETPGKSVLFIFDEPTVGLHPEDIRQLLSALNYLVNKGHSLLIIEHNLELIKCADYIIDLGPEGGPLGGEIVASGTPEEVAKAAGSYTGQCLASYLKDN